MPAPFKEVTTLYWTFLFCLIAFRANGASGLNSCAGINTTLFLCSSEATEVDLLASLEGNPDGNGIWTEVVPYGVDLDNPNAVDLSFLLTGTYDFIYTIPETVDCPATSAILTILLQHTIDADDVLITTFCDDNSTPTDTFDDTFSYTVLVNAPTTGSGSVMTGSGFIISSDPSQSIYGYDTTVGPFGDDLIDDGSVFITINDLSINGICVSEPIEILPPNNCSECNESVSAEASFPLACTNPFVLLTGSGSTIGTYSWTSANGFESNLPNPTVSDTGTYVLTVLFENGCVGTDSVYVSSNIAIPEVDAGADMTLDCMDSSIQLTGTVSVDNPIIEWTSENTMIEESTSLTPTVTESGWYFLNITNPSNGCSNIDSVFIEAPNNIESATINSLPTGCDSLNSGSIEIMSISGGTAPYLYSINNENLMPTSSFENLLSNDYTIGIEDSNGCTWDTIITIENSSSFTLELGENLNISLGDSVQIIPFVSLDENAFIENITWTNETTLSCSGCFTPFASPSNTTTYEVIMENNFGCIAADEITIFIDRSTSIYIPNVFSPNNDGINDLFQLFSDDVILINELNIYDRWGNQVYRATNVEPSDNIGWDGTFRGQIMNPAVFVYYFDVQLLNGQRRILKGDVTLVR